MSEVLKDNFYSNDRVLLLESTFPSLTYLQDGYLPQAVQSRVDRSSFHLLFFFNSYYFERSSKDISRLITTVSPISTERSLWYKYFNPFTISLHKVASIISKFYFVHCLKSNKEVNLLRKRFYFNRQTIGFQSIRSTTQIWVVTPQQYWISALVSLTLFIGKTVDGVAKCYLVLFSSSKKRLEFQCYILAHFTGSRLS